MKELHELTPAQALRERFQLEANFASAPSPTGYQLEAARTKVLGQGHNGARADTQEWKRIRLMDLMQLTRDLNAQEVDACRLYYHTLATSESVEYNRRRADMHEGDGEEVISPKALDDKGNIIDGWVRVRGFQLRVASFGAVAEHMAAHGAKNGDGQPMTHGAAQRRIKDAQSKVSEALTWLRFKLSQER